MNYYIYYKLKPEQLAAIETLVAKLFRGIEQQFGIRGRWMRRRDDAATYMEVYEGVQDAPAFDAFLEREAAGFGVQRRVERFISAGTPS